MKTVLALIASLFVIMITVIIIIRQVQKKQREKTRIWCILFLNGIDYSCYSSIKSLTEFLNTLSPKERKYCMQILPRIQLFSVDRIEWVKKELQFIKDGTIPPSPPE